MICLGAAEADVVCELDMAEPVKRRLKTRELLCGEALIAVTRLAERLLRIALAGGEPECQNSMILRGVKSLPARFA